MADAEAIVLALLKRMVEAGTLGMDDINAIADKMQASDPDSAHQVRISGLEALIGEPESPLQHQAAVRRKSIRIVPTDGGNETG